MNKEQEAAKLIEDFLKTHPLSKQQQIAKHLTIKEMLKYQINNEIKREIKKLKGK